jgi:two-component system, LuxR family, response regulator FixJ
MIVDDDEAVRASLSAVLDTYGLSTKAFSSATEALENISSFKPDCVVMDVRMPGLDGLVAQRMISEDIDAVPVILITGHGDVSMAVLAMKNGAHDFIEKPVDDERLADAINSAVADMRQRATDGAEQEALLKRFSLLTNREKLIAKMVSDGFSTYAIASKLEISGRTVDHHRASLMAKMQATSLPQLIRFLLKVPGL